MSDTTGRQAEPNDTVESAGDDDVEYVEVTETDLEAEALGGTGINLVVQPATVFTIGT